MCVDIFIVNFMVYQLWGLQLGTIFAN